MYQLKATVQVQNVVRLELMVTGLFTLSTDTKSINLVLNAVEFLCCYLYLLTLIVCIKRGRR